MSNASDARRAALSHAYRVIEDHLYPLMVQAGRLAETDIARRRRHRKLERYLIRRIARRMRKVRAAWWWERGGRP